MKKTLIIYVILLIATGTIAQAQIWQNSSPLIGWDALTAPTHRLGDVGIGRISIVSTGWSPKNTIHLIGVQGLVGTDRDDEVEVDTKPSIRFEHVTGWDDGLTGLGWSQLSTNQSLGITTWDITQENNVLRFSRIQDGSGSSSSGGLEINIMSLTNNGMSITNNRSLEFGAGLTKEASAGTLAYQKFSDALDIVGAGLTAPSRKVKLWAEGGTSLTGNLGVGTNLVNSRLTVQSLLSTNSRLTYDLNSTGTLELTNPNNLAGSIKLEGNSVGQLGLSVTGNDLMLSTGSANKMSFLVGNSEKMTLSSDGNLVIGTVYNTPNASQYKLAVDGKIICTELRVASRSTWPDYVFSKEYKLPTIEEETEYFKQNSRLMGFPGAQEIEKNGIDLSEIVKAQQETIEKMMIYISQLNSKIENK